MNLIPSYMIHLNMENSIYILCNPSLKFVVFILTK